MRHSEEMRRGGRDAADQSVPLPLPRQTFLKTFHGLPLAFHGLPRPSASLPWPSTRVPPAFRGHWPALDLPWPPTRCCCPRRDRTPTTRTRRGPRARAPSRAWVPAQATTTTTACGRAAGSERPAGSHDGWERDVRVQRQVEEGNGQEVACRRDLLRLSIFAHVT